MGKVIFVYDTNDRLLEEGTAPAQDEIRRERVFESNGDGRFRVTERFMKYDGREWKSLDRRGAQSYFCRAGILRV